MLVLEQTPGLQGNRWFLALEYLCPYMDLFRGNFPRVSRDLENLRAKPGKLTAFGAFFFVS